MDLIVYTADGSVQSVSGVNESTTCAQIVYALAHARQQKGRFTLIARLNGSSSQDHRFAPNERPYEFVMKCYEQGLQPEFELLMFDPESHKCDHDEHSQNHALNSSNIPSIGSLKDSSLSYSVDYCRVRPTPPDYNVFMVERCNSLRRCNLVTQKTHTPLTFLNIPNFCLHDLYIHKFEFAQLEALIEIQERTLAAQKTELVRVELTLLDSKERELIQLRKQHNNLLTVLDSLHKSEWQKCVDSESTEAERLNTAIAAMRTAIAEKMRFFP